MAASLKDCSDFLEWADFLDRNHLIKPADFIADEKEDGRGPSGRSDSAFTNRAVF
jgi:hypothetical protein